MAPEKTQNEIDDAEFSAAFNEDQPAKAEQSEDEAFGLTPDESGTPANGANADVVTVEGDGEPEGEAVAEGEGMTTDTGSAEEQVAEPVVEAAAAAEEGPTDPKEVQRQKSWEGRLKAREEELRLREEALASAAKPEKAEVTIGAETAPLSEEPGEAVAELAAAVDSGEMTPEQAMKTLEEDFGPEFVKMLDVMVSARAGKAVEGKVGEVSKTMDRLISEIVDDKARGHFEAISDAHPDFTEIHGSEAFQAYKASLSDEQRAAAEKTESAGSARQIVKLLDNFKSWSETAKPADKAAAEPAGDAGMGDINDSAADAAEGVRSTGMALPGAPEKDDSYESAWAKF